MNNIKIDKYGRPLEDTCRVCGKTYELDYSMEDKYGDELRPVRDYCPEHSSTRNNHPYPGI